jgi:S1-C subfamily serine protease
MRTLTLLAPLLLLAACQPRENRSLAAAESSPPAEAVIISDTRPAPADLKSSVLRIRSTSQSWSPGQPWEKNEPVQRRALAAIVGPGQVVTTAEMVADATYLEFESPDGARFAGARVLAVDYEANLALLGPEEGDAGVVLFENTTPLEIAEPSSLGQTLDALQVEDNGATLLTAGVLQSIDVTSNFLPEHSFLTYLVKASMQSAAGSYSLPVLSDGRLAGLLISYNSKDQIIDVTATDILARFLAEASAGDYRGFPGLGVGVTRTVDTSFRQWLKLGDGQGGVYISKVLKGGAADQAGVRKGDVLLAVDGNAIDRRGYYEHPNYGSLFWGHLVRGEKSIGETVALSLLRGGEPLEITATLTREEEGARLVPNYSFGKAPNYLVKGGLVFQELSRPLLEAFGKDWPTRAPLNLLDAYENPEKFEDRMERVVFLSGTIATPATVGYERLRNLIVKSVNGREVRDMQSLIKAFDTNLNELHSIEFAEEDFTVYLDELVSTGVDGQLLQRGLTRLSRAE